MSPSREASDQPLWRSVKGECITLRCKKGNLSGLSACGSDSMQSGTGLRRKQKVVCPAVLQMEIPALTG